MTGAQSHIWKHREHAVWTATETFSCSVPTGLGATSFCRYVNVPGSLNFSPGKVPTTPYSEPPKAQSFSKHMRPRTVLEEAGSRRAWSGPEQTCWSAPCPRWRPGAHSGHGILRGGIRGQHPATDSSLLPVWKITKEWIGFEQEKPTRKDKTAVAVWTSGGEGVMEKYCFSPTHKNITLGEN